MRFIKLNIQRFCICSLYVWTQPKSFFLFFNLSLSVWFFFSTIKISLPIRNSSHNYSWIFPKKKSAFSPLSKFITISVSQILKKLQNFKFEWASQHVSWFALYLRIIVGTNYVIVRVVPDCEISQVNHPIHHSQLQELWVC